MQHTIAAASQGLYPLNGKMSYRHISRSLKTARLDVIIIVSLNFGRHLGKFQSDWKQFKTESRGFVTSRELAARRPVA